MADVAGDAAGSVATGALETGSGVAAEYDDSARELGIDSSVEADTLGVEVVSLSALCLA